MLRAPDPHISAQEVWACHHGQKRPGRVDVENHKERLQNWHPGWDGTAQRLKGFSQERIARITT